MNVGTDNRLRHSNNGDKDPTRHPALQDMTLGHRPLEREHHRPDDKRALTWRPGVGHKLPVTSVHS